jgi:trypsin
VCRQQWPAFGKVWSTRRTLCAGTPGQPAGICSGDQGGPLFVKGRNVKQDRLVGIAAFNGPKGCGRGGLSGFLNVAQYRGWIDLGLQVRYRHRAAAPTLGS